MIGLALAFLDHDSANNYIVYSIASLIDSFVPFSNVKSDINILSIVVSFLLILPNNCIPLKQKEKQN